MTKTLREELSWVGLPSDYPIKSFGNYVANCVPLQHVLAVAGLLIPEFVSLHDHVLLRQNLKDSDLEKTHFTTRFGADKRTVERYYNLTSIEEFFLLAADESSQYEHMLKTFAHVLEHFWGIALSDAFPNRRFEFEIANDLYDEEGLCITFWQV
jgi:hypothetical protein